MNGKRNRKNVTDILSANCKKSKITEANVVFDNIKHAKKANSDMSLIENIVVRGTKRKLLDASVPSIQKKNKEKEKDVDNIDNKWEQKKSTTKRSRSEDNEKCYINKNILNSNIEILVPFVQKISKKKNKLKNNISGDHINSLLQKHSVSSSEEIKVNINESSSNNVINEDIIEMEQCVKDNEMDLSVNDLKDNCFPVNDKLPKKREVISWPEEDLKKLIDRMEACIPEHDTLAFGTRAEKLEWDMIAFKEYTVDDCKKTWCLIQKQIRKFRLLKEVLSDAKVWICTPKRNKKKICRHPDMPRKPLSAYFIYYLQKKDVSHKANPGLDATEISKILGQEFNNLTPEKKIKYDKLAVKQKMEYEKKLDEFYRSHPEVPQIIKSQKIKSQKKPKAVKLVKEKPVKILKERMPKRPPPPFHYYYLSELEKEQKEVDDRLAFKELCKDHWKQLPDEKKVIWINNAETEYAKYEEALAKYLQAHPDCILNPHKYILTKEEIQIKDRVAGKPIKPPGSAYNLFASMSLQSDEIKSIPIKDRLNFVSNQWKNCQEDEKNQYRDLYTKLNEKYKLDYASYLETLTDEERKMEFEKNLPKQRKPKSLETDKKKKVLKRKSERKITARKIVEPEQPPISAFKYFATMYTGDEPVLQAWKSLSPQQKKIYEDELVKKKQAYIVDFEKFLKSLTKEELEAFSNSRRRIKEYPQGHDDDGTETSDESGTEESGAESIDDGDEDALIN